MCEFRIVHSHRYREIFLRQRFSGDPPKELQEIRKLLIQKLKMLYPQKTDEEHYLASRVVVSLAEGVASLSSLERLQEGKKIMELGMESFLKGFR